MYVPLHLLAGARVIVSVEVGDTVIILLEIASETREYLVEASYIISIHNYNYS